MLDLAFIRKDADGSIVGVDIADVSLQGDIDGMLFAAASSGLVGGDGLEEVGRLVHPAHLPMDDMRERLEAAVDDRPIIEL